MNTLLAIGELHHVWTPAFVGAWSEQWNSNFERCTNCIGMAQAGLLALLPKSVNGAALFVAAK